MKKGLLLFSSVFVFGYAGVAQTFTVQDSLSEPVAYLSNYHKVAEASNAREARLMQLLKWDLQSMPKNLAIKRSLAAGYSKQEINRALGKINSSNSYADALVVARKLHKKGLDSSRIYERLLQKGYSSSEAMYAIRKLQPY